MAVPSSGPLQLYGDIGTELGVAQSNVSLHGMSQTAGFSTPDAMSEFYGYDPTPPLTTSFNTVLYTGDNTTSRNITGVGFNPDMVWVKNRSSAGENHAIGDTVRGGGVILYPNLTNTENGFEYITPSGVSDGFTITTNNNNALNNNYVAWCWKAGGAAVTNTNGTITSQVSANTEAGFSVVSYTGNQTNATVGHGLGVAPKVVIAKGRDYVQNWAVYHYDIGVGKWLLLNGSNAAITENIFGGVHPNPSTFSLNGNVVVNKNGGTNIAYCFAEVAGFSKFGSYTGTQASGNTVTLGFEPAFVMIKCTSNTMNWVIFDNKRDTTNPNEAILYPNLNNAEDNVPGAGVNFLANGFELDTVSGGWINTSGYSYIYMAFANQF